MRSLLHQLELLDVNNSKDEKDKDNIDEKAQLFCIRSIENLGNLKF